MKNIRWTILAALILATPTVARAQEQAPGAPGAPAAAGAPTGDSGAISNTADSTTTTTNTTQTTTTSSPGIGPDVAITEETTGESTTELANTGGEPIILSLLGLSMAAGAFFVRRRVTG